MPGLTGEGQTPAKGCFGAALLICLALLTLLGCANWELLG